MDDRQWAHYLSISGIQAEREPREFTPTWGNDFSADPSGDISYMDFGAVVVMWSGTALTGTSDTTTFSLSGLPDAIVPTGNRQALCILGDNNLIKNGSVYIDTSGTMTFALSEQVGTHIEPNIALFTAASAKGLPAGWIVMYVK
jgi:hypothetical protein